MRELRLCVCVFIVSLSSPIGCSSSSSSSSSGASRATRTPGDVYKRQTLQGAIYYNSYGTSLVTNSATDGLDSYGLQYGAATLAILPHATAPTLIAGISSVNPTGDGTGCRVCHTVSATGRCV